MNTTLFFFLKAKPFIFVKSGDDFHITRLKEHGEDTHAVLEGSLQDADEEDLDKIYDIVSKEVEARADTKEKNPFLPELE